jgi:hypothetical protein
LLIALLIKSSFQLETTVEFESQHVRFGSRHRPDGLAETCEGHAEEDGPDHGKGEELRPDNFQPAASEQEFQKFLGSYAGRILTGGHTHAQQIRRIGKLFFFNPGSVGIAYNHEQTQGKGLLDPWAEYAVLTARGLQASLEFIRIPLDLGRMADVYRNSSMPSAGAPMDKYMNYRG